MFILCVLFCKNTDAYRPIRATPGPLCSELLRGLLLPSFLEHSQGIWNNGSQSSSSEKTDSFTLNYSVAKNCIYNQKNTSLRIYHRYDEHEWTVFEGMGCRREEGSHPRRNSSGGRVMFVFKILPKLLSFALFSKVTNPSFKYFFNEMEIITVVTCIIPVSNFQWQTCFLHDYFYRGVERTAENFESKTN